MEIKYIMDVLCPYCYVQSEKLIEQGIYPDIYPVRLIKEETPVDGLDVILQKEMSILKQFYPDYRPPKAVPVYSDKPDLYLLHVKYMTPKNERNKKVMEVATKIRRDFFLEGKKVDDINYLNSVMDQFNIPRPTNIDVYRPQLQKNEEEYMGIQGVPKLILNDRIMLLGLVENVKEYIPYAEKIELPPGTMALLLKVI